MYFQIVSLAGYKQGKLFENASQCCKSMRELDVGTQLKIKDFFDFLRTFSLLDFGQIVTQCHMGGHPTSN